jgi:hypothetical protein
VKEIKKQYLAKKELFPQLEPVVDVMLNLSECVSEIAEKFSVDEIELMKWVVDQLPMNFTTEYPITDEENTDDDDDGDE